MANIPIGIDKTTGKQHPIEPGDSIVGAETDDVSAIIATQVFS